MSEITGSNNIVIGANSGKSITTGSGNILIGDRLDVPKSDTCNYVNIGGVELAVRPEDIPALGNEILKLLNYQPMQVTGYGSPAIGMPCLGGTGGNVRPPINPALDLPAPKECEHQRIFSNKTLLTSPPQYNWICRNCGFKGRLISNDFTSSETYDELVKKFDIPV